MLKRVSAVFLAVALLATSAQAGIINISGTLNFNDGTAGNPPNYNGPGRYAFTAKIHFIATNPATNPVALNITTVNFSAAGFAAPYDIPVFPNNPDNFLVVEGMEGTDDTVIVALDDRPGQLADDQQILLNFRFTNTADPISNNMGTEQNILDVVNGSTLDVFSSSMFQGPGDPPQIIVEDVEDVEFSITAAPEPSSIALLGVMSVAGTGWYRRRKASSTVAA